MQPYFFPYLGYWQLLNHADRFVLYDDVNYIKRGWINRNRILINGEPHYLTIPVCDASQNKRICDLSIADSGAWREKMLKSIDNAYRKWPFYAEVLPVIDEIIRYDTTDLVSYVKHQIVKLSDYLGINTEIIESSRTYGNSDLSAQQRILDICAKENADIYLNTEGGRTLYDHAVFDGAGTSLQFIKMNPVSYAQIFGGFVPNLSVVDMLMAVGKGGVKEFLTDFALIEAGF